MRIWFSLPTVSYCEAISMGLISRPFAALSNLTYFLVAYLIFKNAKGSKVAKNFAKVVFLVATFSLIYDLKSIYLTQIFDLSGMLIFISFLLYLDVSKLTIYYRSTQKFSEKRELITTQSSLISSRFATLRSNNILIASLVIVNIVAISVIILFKGLAGNIVFGSLVLTDVLVQDILYRKN